MTDNGPDAIARQARVVQNWKPDPGDDRGPAFLATMGYMDNLVELDVLNGRRVELEVGRAYRDDVQP